ncbi:uncharacterized protein LOC122818210 [Drosophila biarmipes]|uniref:uncharacterized protein LOC122818210 n=1 Tax=Drosophila biarmipes TaxID=125945 RepID=UPI001CDA9F3A|nr:uncharacterized protein LOC122818210 [Drosophila biarmipes]
MDPGLSDIAVGAARMRSAYGAGVVERRRRGVSAVSSALGSDRSLTHCPASEGRSSSHRIECTLVIPRKPIAAVKLQNFRMPVNNLRFKPSGVNKVPSKNHGYPY